MSSRREEVEKCQVDQSRDKPEYPSAGIPSPEVEVPGRMTEIKGLQCTLDEGIQFTKCRRLAFLCIPVYPISISDNVKLLLG